MKLSKSLGMLLTLICITVIAVTTFRLSPSFARTTPAMSAQESAEKVTTDRIALSFPENTLYTRLGGYNAIAKVIDDSTTFIFADPVIGKYGVAELRYDQTTVPGSSGRIAFKSEYLNDYLNMEWERPKI